MTPQAVLGLLAEPERLRVFSAVVLGASAPSAVTAAAGVSSKEAGAALRRLEEGGLVEYVDGGVRARPERLKDAVRQAAKDGTPGAGPVDHGTGDEDTETLLRTFLRDGGRRISSLPRRFGRRRIVLHHLARRFFEPGAAYAERDVNEILRAWCDGGALDHVTVRRYLIDHCLLSREDGVYRLCEDAPAKL